jgi:DNA primase
MKQKDRPGRARAPLRALERPDPNEWSEEELMTLAEAAAVFWPSGLLTETSLRTAVRDRRLDVSEIAGKLLTNKSAINRMCVCRPRGETALLSEARATATVRPGRKV